MKKIKLVLALCLSSCLSFAQVGWPAKNLAMPPNDFNTNVDPPTNASIGYGGSGAYTLSSGAYDASGNLKFIVRDLIVYYSGGLIGLPYYTAGGITYDSPGHEVEIVPVPGSSNCNQFYVIYELNPNWGGGSYIAYVMIDCTSGTPVLHTPSNNILNSSSTGYGLAVSKITTTSNIRYLFSMDWQNGMQRFTIGTWSGSVGINGQTTLTTLNTTILNNSGDICELELSPDQTRLAWNGAPYDNTAVYEISLTSSYGFSSYSTYNITGSTQIYGLEYAQPTKTTNRLYVATSGGITYFTPGSSPTYNSLTTTTNYGTTQLELAGTGDILGVYTGGSYDGKLFKINVANNTVALSSNTTQIYSNNYVNASNKHIYHLPDGLDVPTLTASINSTKAINGSNITATATYTANFTPDYYFWSITQCTSTGGSYPGGYSWNSGYVSGTPSGAFTFPSTSTLPCNTYYQLWFWTGGAGTCAGQWVTAPILYTTLDANFVLSGTKINSTTYTATATYPTDNPSGFSYYWDVVQVTGSGGSPVAGTDMNSSVPPNCWWTYSTPLKFWGYNGTSTLGSCSNVGAFIWGDYYNITFGVWSSACAWTQTVQTLALCGSGCRTANNPDGIIISENLNAPDQSGYLQTLQTNNSAIVDASITIYPNPNRGNFILTTNTTEKQLIRIFDVTGKMVLNQNINGETHIDASSLPDGVYNINITGNNSITNKKLVIVR